MTAGSHDGHAPTIGLANKLWHMTDEEIAERFGELGDDQESEVRE